MPNDFIAPKGEAADYISAFACTGGIGCHEQHKFKEAGDIDKAILLEAVTDRLAEAFAELIHLKIRTTLWGYAPDEKLSLEQLLKGNTNAPVQLLAFHCSLTAERSSLCESC